MSEIRQGGWILEHGFACLDPNPVTDVEMRSVLVDGFALTAPCNDIGGYLVLLSTGSRCYRLLVVSNTE